MRCAIPLYLLLLLAGGSSATTYVVNPEGTGDFPTIQVAVNSVADGNTILLSDGLFHGLGNRGIDLSAGVPWADMPVSPRIREAPRNRPSPHDHTLHLQQPRPDTLWFGGDDGNGLAMEGGIWDWDTDVPPDDPFEGWTVWHPANDQTLYFGRVTEEDFLLHGDSCVPMFPGTEGMIWCGIHEDEAFERDFPGGMGYKNHMRQRAVSPEFSIEPMEDEISLDFLYFNDTELEFDYVFVEILNFDSAHEPLSGDAHVHRVSCFDGLIGSYDHPSTYTGDVPPMFLPTETAFVRLCLRMCSDGGWSDEDGHWDTECGPFAADDIRFSVGDSTAFYDFEIDANGWTFESACPAWPTYMHLVPEETWAGWLLEAGVEECGMGGNAISLANVEGGGWPFCLDWHDRQYASTGKIARPQSLPDVTHAVVCRWDHYSGSGYGRPLYRVKFTYYPYTTEWNPTPHWSRPLGADSWRVCCVDMCFLDSLDLCDPPDGTPLPADWDSLQVIYEMSCYDPFWEDGCETYGGPMIDNFRVGISPHPAGVDEGNESDRPQVGDFLFPVQLNVHGCGASISFRLEEATHVSLSIYDLSGRLVRSLVDEARDPGLHAASWNGTDAANRQVGSGLFWVRMRTGEGYASSRPVVVLR